MLKFYEFSELSNVQFNPTSCGLNLISCKLSNEALKWKFIFVVMQSTLVKKEVLIIDALQDFFCLLIVNEWPPLSAGMLFVYQIEIRELSRD